MKTPSIKMSRIPLSLLAMLLCVDAWAGAPESSDVYNVTDASMHELIIHAQQSGDTPERRKFRKNARDEIFARGTNAFHYLLSHFHIENMTIRMLTDEMVRKTLEEAEAAGVLVQYLGSEHEMTRKSAAYFLGYCKTPQYAERLMPLLEDEKAAGAAARSLGKWGITNAMARILPQLNHEEERRRVLAVNALSDIGDPSAIPYFLAALDDPVFTVRKVARGALARHAADAASAALDALENAPPAVQREIMGLCVDVGYLAATNALAGLCGHTASPSVKRDAQRCFKELQQLAPASESETSAE